MILLYILIAYHKDCKKYGKENLAVSLKDRLFSYYMVTVVPVIVGVLSRK